MKQRFVEYAKGTAGLSLVCAANFFVSTHLQERTRREILKRNPNAEVETVFRQLGGLGGYWEVREVDPNSSSPKPR